MIHKSFISTPTDGWTQATLRTGLIPTFLAHVKQRPTWKTLCGLTSVAGSRQNLRINDSIQLQSAAEGIREKAVIDGCFCIQIADPRRVALAAVIRHLHSF